MFYQFDGVPILNLNVVFSGQCHRWSGFCEGRGYGRHCCCFGVGQCASCLTQGYWKARFGKTLEMIILPVFTILKKVSFGVFLSLFQLITHYSTLCSSKQCCRCWFLCNEVCSHFPLNLEVGGKRRFQIVLFCSCSRGEKWNYPAFNPLCDAAGFRCS